MYFASRTQAGRMLATQLLPKHKDKNCAVIALNDGGVVVGAQIAAKLHCVLTMLLIEEVKLPREPLAVGGVLEDGTFSYNHAYSSGELDEITSEYRSVIEQEKYTRFQHMNSLIGSQGLINRRLLKNHTIILVADAFRDSFILDMALEFLKPIQLEYLVAAAPISGVQAIDRMHVTMDEINVLDVIEDMMETDHYFDTNDIPSHDQLIKIIEQIVGNWK